MKVTGQISADGSVINFITPFEVVQFGDTLRDKFDGFTVAVKDEYGDWVSPTLRGIGVKATMILEGLKDA